MTNFIPIFPLSIVVYPHEELNLHVFEPKYLQLIKHCMDKKRPFGIPVVLDENIQEYGTLLQIIKLSQVHPNGAIDIKTRGLKVFRVLETLTEVPGKLYSGAIVNYPINHEHGKRTLMKKVLKEIKQLHTLLHVTKKITGNEDELWSYDVAHAAGLTRHQEYDLLLLMNELQRQEYLNRHLAYVLPVLTEMEVLKEKIKLNGHFKHIAGFDLF